MDAECSWGEEDIRRLQEEDVSHSLKVLEPAGDEVKDSKRLHYAPLDDESEGTRQRHRGGQNCRGRCAVKAIEITSATIGR